MYKLMFGLSMRNVMAGKQLLRQQGTWVQGRSFYGRKWLGLFLGVMITCMGLGGCVNSSESSNTEMNLYKEFDAIVAHSSAKFKGPSGVQTFPSLEAALSAAPKDNSTYRIYMMAGQYYEKLVIKRDNLVIQGAGSGQTFLYYDDYAGRIAPGTTKKMGTTKSASLTVKSSNVAFHDLSIENRFDFLSNDALDKNASNRINSTQAVAIKLEKKADKILFKNTVITGYQDTVYGNGGRAAFVNSTIKGNVDFIFGAGNMVFYKSDIVTLGRGRPVDVVGYITAPSTQIESNFGITFIECRLLRDDSVPDNSTALGRPWHPTVTFDDGRYADPNAIGKTVFINSFMDAHITREGWSSMTGTAKGGGPKQVFTPESSRFYEFNSTGPGANNTVTRRQLTDKQAQEYTLNTILDGWDIL